MEVQSVLEQLERLAVSILERSQATLRSGPDDIGGNVLQRGMDSLDFVDYLMAVEQEHGFRVSDEEIEAHDLLRTDKMASFLVERMGG